MKHSSIAVLALVLAAACAKGDTSAGDTAAATSATPAASSAPSGAAACAGTYTQASPSFSPKFVFNADGTGEETRAASQGGAVRKFTWVQKGDGQVTITFPAEGNQAANSTDWNIDCRNGTFAGIYKKS